MTDEKKKASKRITSILLIISLVICLVSVIGANALQTSGGQVEVTQVTIGTKIVIVSNTPSDRALKKFQKKLNQIQQSAELKNQFVQSVKNNLLNHKK